MADDNKEEQLDAERAQKGEDLYKVQKEKSGRGIMSTILGWMGYGNAKELTGDTPVDNKKEVKAAQRGTRSGTPKIEEEVVDVNNFGVRGYFRRGEGKVHIVSKIEGEDELVKQAQQDAKERAYAHAAVSGEKGKDRRNMQKKLYNEFYADEEESIKFELADNLEEAVGSRIFNYFHDKWEAVDKIRDKASHDMTIAHEYQHMKNMAKGIYSPAKDGTWLGCEAFAKIDAADEIGARYAEVNHVRNEYIKAGGGEKGLEAVEKYTEKNALAEQYVDLIKEGKVDPLSKDQGKQAEELVQISGIVQGAWNSIEWQYEKQLKCCALCSAQDYNIENIRHDDEETKRRCGAAMTIEMNMGGKKVPVNFMELGGMEDIHLPPEVKRDMKTMDENPALVQEYIKSGPEKFNQRTASMEQEAKELGNDLSELNAARFGDNEVMPELKAEQSSQQQVADNNRQQQVQNAVQKHFQQRS